MQKMKWIRIIFLYIFTTILTAVALIFLTRTNDDYRVFRGGSVAPANVEKMNCDIHMSFVYRFSVNGKSFVGLTSSPDCHEIQVGDVVSVHYLGSDPGINFVGDPARRLLNNLIAIFFASQGICLMFFYSVFRKAVRRSS